MARHVDPDHPRESRARATRALLERPAEWAAEFALGLAACATFGAAVTMVTWGRHRHPLGTALAGAAMLALSAFGVRELLRPARTSVRPLAAAAAGIALVFTVWLALALSYCACG